MTNVVVASFDTDAKAIQAMHKLSELESYGDISIYKRAIVRAGENGKYDILDENADSGWRTLTGMGIGSLLGALGGPVGFVIGLFTGTTIGLISDIGRDSFNEGFVDKVEKRMPVGTVSIIAEIDEDSDIYVDNALLPLGAVIERSSISYEFDDYMDDQFDEIEKDLAESREKMKTSVGNEKEKIAQKIADLKKKRSEAVAKRKSEIIKKRIANHEEKLGKLKEELQEIKA